MEPLLIILLIFVLDILVIYTIVKQDSRYKFFYGLLVLLIPVLGISIYYFLSYFERKRYK